MAQIEKRQIRSVDSSTLDGTPTSLSGSFSGSFQGDGSSLSEVGESLPANVVSSSIQIDHDQTTNYLGTEHFTQGAISITEFIKLNIGNKI